MIQNDVGTVVPERLTPFLYPQNLENDEKNDEKWFKITKSLHKWSKCNILNDLDILNVDKNDHIHVDCMSDTVPNEQFT